MSTINEYKNLKEAISLNAHVIGLDGKIGKLKFGKNFIATDKPETFEKLGGLAYYDLDTIKIGKFTLYRDSSNTIQEYIERFNKWKICQEDGTIF